MKTNARKEQLDDNCTLDNQYCLDLQHNLLPSIKIRPFLQIRVASIVTKDFVYIQVTTNAFFIKYLK